MVVIVSCHIGKIVGTLNRGMCMCIFSRRTKLRIRISKCVYLTSAVCVQCDLFDNELSIIRNVKYRT